MTLPLANQWTARLKLRAEGDKLWAEEIIEAYGNITLRWEWISNDGPDCILGNGEHYRHRKVTE